MILHSKRLRLRSFEPRDAEPFFRLNGDPRVMRFFAGAQSRRESDALLGRILNHEREHGFSFLAAERREGGGFIGMIGLARVGAALPFAPAVEIGWRLVPEVWGHGLAGEGAAACLDHAFAAPPVAPRIVAFCAAGNRASEAVMVRLGFVREPDFDHPAIDEAARPDLVRHRLYRIARHHWLARRSPSRPAGGG